MAKKINQSVLKQYSDIITHPLDGVTVTSDDPSETWLVNLAGPINTPYEGGFFLLEIDFPDSFPFKPPTVRWITRIYHPSIQMDTGKMCHCSYKKNWLPISPLIKARNFINFFRMMLVYPGNDPCSHPEMLDELVKDRPSFIKKAKEYTRKYADSCYSTIDRMPNLSLDTQYWPNVLNEIALAGNLRELKVNTSQGQVVSLLQTSVNPLGINIVTYTQTLIIKQKQKQIRQNSLLGAL